ncbi:MFS transporter [Micropruina sp.]|uniref:MFS transporter n=1 Tax=Micropruina sp. TaxID=2737536 RepID=UPI0026191F30|nr:MFS transporter [Micropruina sp.]
MRAYREILTLPGAWQFSAAGLLARSGGAMMGIGLVLMVSALYGSYGLAGALAASNAVAWALGTAALSNLVDRYGQRRVMYPAAIVSAVMLSLLVIFAMLQLPAWTLFAPAVLSGATGGAPGALVRARWTHLVDDPDKLHTAFSLESTLDEVTFVVGPVLATALSTGVHPAAGLIAPVVLSLAGAHLLYGQRATEPPVSSQPRHPDAPRVRQQFVLLVPGVAAVVAVNLLIGCVFGSIDVSVVAATTEWEVREAAGLVLAVFSLASGLAGFYYGARRWASPVIKRFLIGVAAMCAACVALVGAHSVLLLCVGGLLVGVTVAPTLINANTLIGGLVARDRLTEGLSWMGTGIGIGVAIGSSASGQAIDHAGYSGGLGTVAVFGALAALIAFGGRGALQRAVSPPQARRAVLAGRRPGPRVAPRRLQR